jgi:hypothetical protein
MNSTKAMRENISTLCNDHLALPHSLILSFPDIGFWRYEYTRNTYVPAVTFVENIGNVLI